MGSANLSSNGVAWRFTGGHTLFLLSPLFQVDST
jgi:hypothetical protein